MKPLAPSGGMSPGLTLLFSVAGGMAVANLYWVQPLLHDIGRAFHILPGHAGWLVTLTQIGYAMGVLLIVPLGDSQDRRRLIPGMMAISALALVVSAFAPTFGFLLAGLFLVGLTTVTGQLLIPLAGDLAAENQRGRIVGTVVTVVRQHPTVQVTLLLGALSFSVFTLFWTGLTFLLSSPPFGFSASQIGLVGLVGLAGALAARRAGR